MPERIAVLALPLLACLILTGIHAYLGIHVLSRKVIFVDIALAQIAALGATLAFLLGYDPRSEGAYYLSLSFAVIAAGIFAMTRTRTERIPQEAIIGLTYAVASATSILLADISPHGAEHLKDLLAGSIVWVTPVQILKTGVLYLAIGAFHLVFRRRFLLISLDPAAAYAQGIHVRFWDFLFYLSFGVVITSSVQIAGVLLVFCYLVAPAVFAAMFSDSLRARLTLGWAAGSIVSAVGLLLSYDRPSGPTIMVCFAIALILGGAARGVVTAADRRRAAALALTCAAMVVLVGYGFWRLAQSPPAEEHTHGGESAHAQEAEQERLQAHEFGTSREDLHLALNDSHPGVRASAVDQLAALRDPADTPALVKALDDPSTTVREHAAKALGNLGAPSATAALVAVASRADEDEWVRFRAAQSAAALGDVRGIPSLLAIARSGEARLARQDALDTLWALSGRAAAGGDPAAGTGSLEDVERWWRENTGRLVWDPATRTYRPEARR